MGKRQWAGVVALVASTLLGVTDVQAGSPLLPLTFNKTYGAATVPLNGSTSLTLSLGNPNTGYGATNVAFTDSLPPGLVVSAPNGLVNTCGGMPTAVAGSSSVQLSGGTLAANTTCSVAVSVTGTTLGAKTNTTSALTASGGFLSASGVTRTLQVVAAVVSAASIPTLSEWGLILLVLAMAVSAFKAVRRQR